MPENKNQLHRVLADRIRREGPIPVDAYMGQALDTYYKSKNPFGVAGDFVTAPEVSQMFGEMIAAWLVDIWMQMGRPDEVLLVELGPGRGTLAADILRTVAAWPDFSAAVTLHLVENSPRLQEIQAETLKGHPAVWHERFSSVPEGFCFIVANEFFDALPVRQFEKTGGQWKERCVGHDETKDTFYFTTQPTAAPFPERTGVDGDILEVSPASLSLLENIAQRIAEQGGAALIVDYGHDAPGTGDTLQAVSKHTYADPLTYPGEKDLTSHVDFSAFKTRAAPTVAVAGPVTQGQFLINLGIEARAQTLCTNASDAQRQKIMADLCRLVAPQEMGRLFKVMALTPKGAIINPAGFGGLDHEIADD